ncbi:LysR family transcriptional regulator [Roseibacillus ishigakijimensis]|uniref:LysR family transcriptional regulator n=1 Tax=Roseibacillus ishigakijimensis TaxID=454146 RepID=A0A934RQN0_9BACT|nr:LysR family transcriptional regulator [Roseibacillus ishigakijimensis]MBK1835180.1 LysR family transcriptional regulator [Roseibacillus ishigakijimensis]
MDVRKLRYFVAVAEKSNISEAARELHLTQPALSRQVRAFEEEMGWELLARTGKAVTLTREGEVVLREGRRILKAIEAGERRLRQELAGAELRVGYAPSLAGGLIEQAMSVFCQMHPQVRVRLHDSTSEELWQGLRQGELDLILEVATEDADIHWQTLRQRHLRVAVPAGHRYEKRRRLKAADLDGERLLLLSRIDYPNYWRAVTDYFAEYGLNAKVAGEFDGIESLRMGLIAGLGMAFVAEGTSLPSTVSLVKIDPDPQPICVAVGWLASRSLESWEEIFVAELQRAVVR